MLPSASSLKNDLSNLPSASGPADGSVNFVGAISAFMNQVQGGPLGTPGIFALMDAAMIAIMSTLTPTSGDAWKSTLADAWEAAVLAAIITPATVTNPTWIGSGGKDVLTLPAAPASIPTLSAAKAVLVASLASVGPTDDAPLPLASAFRDATLAFVFNCIGLGPPPAFPPIPIPTPAL